MPLFRDQVVTSAPAFVQVTAAPKRSAEALANIKLSVAGQAITVKWSASDPEGCALFIRAVA
ncbi:hypothetical protein D8767_26940 [Pseudomonas sp. LTGT-11-2Z]|nr:hypothetical protein D8767_26940 [Pseudomonas sp. LTGT-11-2Z]